MNYEDVQKVSNAAKAKSNLVNTNFFKYFIRAVMAGFFIDVAMIYSNVVGNVFSKTMPEWGKFVGALVFSIAVLLISFVGGELFTGNNMVMAFGAYDKQVSWKEAGKVWGVSYLGNFVGCAILALLFVGAGASGTADYFAGLISACLVGSEMCIRDSFVTAYCLVPGLSLGAMVKSMVVVTLGNMVGGALLLAWPLRKMSADK